MSYNKKMRKLLLLPVVLLAGYFLLSLLMYQRLVNEGSVLADNQCLRVNPVIIERKNHYLKSMEAAKNNDVAGQEGETTAYLERSKQYVEEQNKWLETQNTYINRWDFQFFLPGYMKQAAQLQYDSRVADVESTNYLIEAFEVAPINETLSQELVQKSLERSKLRNEKERQYNELWDTTRRLDWRIQFISVPKTKCPDENFEFPDEEIILPTDTPLSLNNKFIKNQS
jgi:hypothetical protein